MTQTEGEGDAPRRQGAPAAGDAGFRAPRRRRKPLLAAAVVVFAVVGALAFLMARGPDPERLATDRIAAMLRGLPDGAISTLDIRATSTIVHEALALHPGNQAAVEAGKAVRSRLAAQIAGQIDAGALDAAEDALGAAVVAWPEPRFDADGSLRRRLDAAIEERELRAEVARLVAAAEERLLADGSRTRNVEALRDALRQLEGALAIDPGNERAQSVKASVATQARSATSAALAAGQPEQARRVLDAVGDRWPKDSEFDAWRREVEGKLAALDRQGEVERLLGLASDRLASDRLGQPAGDSAVEHYRRVLALAPDNTAAQDGLARVAARYGALVRAAIGDDALARAGRLHGSFSEALPGHPDLDRLGAEIEAAESAAAQRRAEAANQAAHASAAAAPAKASGRRDDAAPAMDDEGRLWQAVRDSCRDGDLQRYTTAYPAGRYAEEAWRRISACVEARE